jgi:hypothetical protein
MGLAENIATVVNWFGPYKGRELDEIPKSARLAAKYDYAEGLYAAIGHRPQGALALLYMGVGANLHQRLNSNHHKLNRLPLHSLWLGEVSVAGVPGRRKKKINPHLDIVEWATAYFLRLPFNERKSKSPPPNSCVVVNRWWGTDYEKQVKRPVAGWADIIEYDSVRGTANLVWFGASARVKTIKVTHT